MASTPKVVVVASRLPPAGFELVSERFAVEAIPEDAGPDWPAEHVVGAAAIVAEPGVEVDGELLDRAGDSLRVVANFGVGYDNIDLEAARARGVRATNTPDVLTNATAELAVALMLATARRIAAADALVRRDEWRGPDPERLLGRELSGAVVGLVGHGRIARRVAELLSGFGVRLLTTSRSGGRGLDDVLPEADFVSVHVPLTPQTRHMINARALNRMRPGAILVNTSRGAVIDTPALIDALRSGPLGGAGLDVYEDEPHVPEALRELPNTVLLPHVGSATATTRDAMARLCAENVIAVIEGREPPSPVA
jgi:glyoxylate reductase